MGTRRRLRIRTVHSEIGRMPRGIDTIVEVIDDEGNAERLMNVASVEVNIDSNHGFVRATLGFVDVELDVEATEDDHAPPSPLPQLNTGIITVPEDIRKGGE